MIQVQELKFGYRKKRAPLFQDLNLDLQPGTITGILGKNGAGKTTLLRLVSGLLHPQNGQALVNGTQSKDRAVGMLSELYYVQEEYILPEITVVCYEKIYASFYPNWDADKFQRILQEFELPQNGKLKELSFGQKKKFLIAFALATGAKVLILDEPTNGLDIPSKIIFRKVVSNSLNEDQSILISTHQVKDVANLLDRIVVVEGGRVIFNQDLFSISEKFRFDFYPGSSLPEKYFYAEQVPGGHVAMLNNEDQHVQTEVDLEILFNAIISKSI